jgi:predicted anti-sigma-YlaC factor YlaD
MMAALIDEGVSEPAPVSIACPSCRSMLARGSVICTSCGFNVQSNTRATTKVEKAPKRKAEREGAKPVGTRISEVLTVLLNPVGIGATVLAVFGVLFYLGQEDEQMVLLYAGLASALSLVAGVWLLIAAFAESVVHGLLVLCLPFYAIYFVLGVADSDMLKSLVLTAFIVNTGNVFLQASATGSF